MPCLVRDCHITGRPSNLAIPVCMHVRHCSSSIAQKDVVDLWRRCRAVQGALEEGAKVDALLLAGGRWHRLGFGRWRWRCRLQGLSWLTLHLCCTHWVC